MSLGTYRLCVIPKASGVGGMVSFRHKLEQGLVKHGVRVTYDAGRLDYDAVLVIGGTRRLADLRAARKRGIPVIQRLDGMNWLHRKTKTGLRHYGRAEASNFILGTIRNRFADRIVYQSEFSRTWWEREHGETRVPFSIVYNGVDLSDYAPGDEDTRPKDVFRLLLVEGNLGGGYETGLEHALQLGELLEKRLSRRLELMIVGRVDPGLRERVTKSTRFPLRWAGLVPRDNIPELDRSAHVLFAADLNPACPNAVIEAFACGLPVAAYATGALPELVQKDAGELADYGGDPWKLDTPDREALAAAAARVIENQDRYRTGARQRAEEQFSLDRMVEGYLRALGWEES